MYRFYDSSDSTILSILRFSTVFSAVDERTRYIGGFYVQLLCYHFHDNLKGKIGRIVESVHHLHNNLKVKS